MAQNVSENSPKLNKARHLFTQTRQKPEVFNVSLFEYNLFIIFIDDCDETAGNYGKTSKSEEKGSLT